MSRKSELIRYDGCCNEYGADKTFAVAVGMPVLFNTAALAIADNPSVETMVTTTTLSLAIAVLGFKSATKEHYRVQLRESRKNTPRLEGNKRARQGQIRAYLKTVVPALLLNFAAVAPAADYASEKFWDTYSFDNTHLKFVKN